ncbi:MAG TPA: hypothetical protein VF380_03195 [Solirubrobacteraceae bacterium]
MAHDLTARSLAVSAAVACGLLAGAAPAGASTIYTCVKKKGGAMRIVGRSTRCRRGESKLAWNRQGPVGPRGPGGPAGANGSSGTNGSNGAVAGFFVKGGEVDFSSGNEGAPVVIVSRPLPPGNFIVEADLHLLLSSPEKAVADGSCTLLDTPSGGGAKSEEGTFWVQALDVPFIGEAARFDIPLSLAVSSPTQPSVISAQCFPTEYSGKAGTLKARSNYSTIAAIETSSNG